MGRIKNNIETRLKESVSIDLKTGCWNWTKFRGHYGYGKIFIGSTLDNTRKCAYAHRVSFSVFKGQIPKGMFVLHTCDNTACINPDHLLLGTPKDNTADMDKKGRRTPKFNGGTINADMAKIIKNDLKTMKMIKISRKRKVPYHVVKDIAKGRSWKRV